MSDRFFNVMHVFVAFSSVMVLCGCYLLIGIVHYPSVLLTFTFISGSVFGMVVTNFLVMQLLRRNKLGVYR